CAVKFLRWPRAEVPIDHPDDGDCYPFHRIIVISVALPIARNTVHSSEMRYRMKIVDVKTHVMGTAWRNLTFVRVLTDEGLEGLGEVRMLNHTDALLGYFAEAVPNHILGHDPFNVEDLVQRMYRNDYARAGEIAMSAIATVEIACWDIKGK